MTSAAGTASWPGGVASPLCHAFPSDNVGGAGAAKTRLAPVSAPQSLLICPTIMHLSHRGGRPGTDTNAFAPHLNESTCGRHLISSTDKTIFTSLTLVSTSNTSHLVFSLSMLTTSPKSTTHLPHYIVLDITWEPMQSYIYIMAPKVNKTEIPCPVR